jgi:coproporphyrinogen III oxidase
MQSVICNGLEESDGAQKFITDEWKRTDQQGGHGGGGITRVITDGAVFEKGGVNFSEVYGTLPEDMGKTLIGRSEVLPFHATGTSLVIHPASPHVPTIHANFRFLTVADRSWVGGGIDLTPYTYNPEAFKTFHNKLKIICDRHKIGFYEESKKQCDSYFFIPHRNETRGIGGVFFDYMGRDDATQIEPFLNLVEDFAKNFNDIYIPIVENTKNLSFTEIQKKFQLYRRGRYVEFNLVYDRGTLFGLKTGGRIESILMSLPKFANWEYNVVPENYGPEAVILSDLFQNPPADWNHLE